MIEPDRRFWPFTPRTSGIIAIVLLILLTASLGISRKTLDWPIKESESTVLIGIFVLSLLPILLALVDIVIEKGGVIKYGGVEIDLSQIRQMGIPNITIPVNIGVRGEPVNESSVNQILAMLKAAMASDVVIIDLEDGHAWWETRLLVLLAGAERLGMPKRIVFLGTVGGKEHCFKGWAAASDLFRCLVSAHPQYKRSLHVSRAAARQWELVEPMNPATPANPMPATPPWINTGLAQGSAHLAFDYPTGLHNELLAEQLLATDLGHKVEQQEAPKEISVVRMEELFTSVLNKDQVDQTWPSEQQLKTFFSSDAPYFAVTQNGAYSILVARLTVLNAVLKTLVEKKAGQ